MKTIFKDIIASIITWQSKLVLNKYKPKIIVVTGSVGKTSTKDAIFSVVSKKFRTRKSQKSFNSSDIGVPLTVLGLPNAWNNPFNWLKNIVQGFMLIVFKHEYPEWLVLEVGADKPGEIRQTASWINSDIVVITHIGSVPVHVEFFESIEHLIEEKRSIVKSLKKNGLLLVDADDPASLNSRDLILDGQKCITFAKDNASQINADEPKIAYENKNVIGMAFHIFHDNKKLEAGILGSLGSHVVYPILAAYAIGNYLDIKDEEIIDALAHHKGPKGRMSIISGMRGSTIIDDTYNASPVAMHNALFTLGQIKSKGKKIAVLGDMLELGEYSAEEHRKVGEHVAKVADILITVGFRARGIASGALGAGMDEASIFQYENSEEAGKFVESLIQDRRGDVILAKGSQSIRMERVVYEIMEEPERAETLLVRQEDNWKR